MWAYTNSEATTAAPHYEQSAPTAGPAQQSFAAAPPAPTNTNIPSSAFPAVSQQICTCIVVPDSTTAAMVEQSHQSAQQAATSAQQAAAPTQQFASPAQQAAALAQQQQAAYSAQQSASAPDQQQQSAYSAQQSAAPAQQFAAPAQQQQAASYSAPSTRPAGGARPAYAAAASTGY